MKYELVHGDCIEVLRKMEDNSVDAVVTDPPYGLEFMGKEWDAPWKGDMRQPGDENYSNVLTNPFGRSKVRHSVSSGYGKNTISNMRAFQKWTQKWAEECLRVLKPGGHLLSFAGSRTYHRVANGIEDAGFEIRDQIMWVYGSGFPKSHNIGHKAEEWDGWGSALKPAHEPIVVARKPLIGTIVENVLEHGTGGLNIDGCRIAHDDSDIKRKTFDNPSGMFTNPNREGERGAGPSPEGRFPANFIHDGSDEVVSLFSESARFFYCAKASQEEKNAGLEHLADVERTDYGGFHSEEGLINNGRNPANRLPMKNPHPTVKPVDLMKYLCRLITPPNGVVLDPFMGSGTTGIGATAEGFSFIGIEREEEYINVARHRISHWVEEKEEQVRQQRAQKSLFDW